MAQNCCVRARLHQQHHRRHGGGERAERRGDRDRCVECLRVFRLSRQPHGPPGVRLGRSAAAACAAFSRTFGFGSRALLPAQAGRSPSRRRPNAAQNSADPLSECSSRWRGAPDQDVWRQRLTDSFGETGTIPPPRGYRSRRGTVAHPRSRSKSGGYNPTISLRRPPFWLRTRRPR